MRNRTETGIYSIETANSSLVDFFKEKYNAAVATELRIRNLLDQLKGECEDSALFQFFKTERLEAIGYAGIAINAPELLKR